MGYKKKKPKRTIGLFLGRSELHIEPVTRRTVKCGIYRDDDRRSARQDRQIAGGRSGARAARVMTRAPNRSHPPAQAPLLLLIGHILLILLDTPHTLRRTHSPRTTYTCNDIIHV